MKSDCSAESWLKFFTSAGIPMESSRTYAVTFSKNEIHLDMLSEIKKEYLVDMGITLMGHIIAILRHAKAVYNENVTKTTLSSPIKSAPSPKTLPKEKPVLKPVPPRIPSEKEAITIVSTSVNKPTTISKADYQVSLSRPRPVTILQKPQIKSVGLQGPEKEMTIKKKESNETQKVKMSSVIVNSVSPSKRRSPAGPTDDLISSNKGKVFERLGNEVSDSPSTSSESNSSNESVFSRLGDKTTNNPTTSRTSPVKVSFRSLANGVEDSMTDFYKKRGSSLQNGTNSKVKSILCTMRADEAEAQSAALARRGRKRTRSPSPVYNRDSLGPLDMENLKKNIKSRLGRISRSVSPTRRIRTNVDEESIALRGVGPFRSDLKTRVIQPTFDRKDERNSTRGKSSILMKRNNNTSPVGSIALSGVSKTSLGVKSRLGQTNTAVKSSNQKKVSFGPVSQQLIPLETKPTYRQFYRQGKSRFAVGFYNDYNDAISINSGSHVFNRLGH